MILRMFLEGYIEYSLSSLINIYKVLSIYFLIKIIVEMGQ